MIPAATKIANGFSPEAVALPMAKRLEDLRWQLRLEWGQLARRIGVSRISLYKWRQGEANPAGKNLERILELEASVGDHP